MTKGSIIERGDGDIIDQPPLIDKKGIVIRLRGPIESPAVIKKTIFKPLFP